MYIFPILNDLRNQIIFSNLDRLYDEKWVKTKMSTKFQ
jgi:hypothetical protein